MQYGIKMDYYDKYFQQYSNDTMNLDMSGLYEEFLKFLPIKSRILDLGCGPGRDTRYFSNLGYDVTGLDPSIEMVKLARENSNSNIIHGSIQETEFDLNFDGIWACASLLHVPSSELKFVFDKISKILNLGGLFFCCFKYGEFEGVSNDGRYFTFQTEEKLRKHLKSILDFEIKKVWISSDIRNDKMLSWINCLIIKR